MIQENNRIITTKKGKGKLPLFCGNIERVILIYGSGYWSFIKRQYLHKGSTIVYPQIQSKRWYDSNTAGHGRRLRQNQNVDRLDTFKEWVFKLSRVAPDCSPYYFSISLHFTFRVSTSAQPANLMIPPMPSDLFLSLGYNTLPVDDDLFAFDFNKNIDLNLLN